MVWTLERCLADAGTVRGAACAPRRWMVSSAGIPRDDKSLPVSDLIAAPQTMTIETRLFRTINYDHVSSPLRVAVPLLGTDRWFRGRPIVIFFVSFVWTPASSYSSSQPLRRLKPGLIFRGRSRTASLPSFRNLAPCCLSDWRS